VENSGTVLDLGATTQTVGVLTLRNATLQNGTLSAGTFNVESGVLSAALKGGGILNKNTTGTVSLGATYNFTGPINVNAGSLLIAGASLSSGSLAVANGASLIGAGSLASTTVTLASGGLLSPGTSMSTGKLTLGGLVLSGGAALNFKLNSPATSDQIAVTQSNGLILGGTNNTISLSLAPGTGSLIPGLFPLISYSGTTLNSGLRLNSNIFAGLDAQLVYGTNNISIQLGTPTPPSVTLSSNAAAYMEPGNTVTFSAVVAGTPSFTYALRKDGIDISTGTLSSSGSLQLSSGSLTTSGSYDLKVTSTYGFGSANSNAVYVTVTDLSLPLTLTIPDSSPLTFAGTLGFRGGVSLVRNGSGAFLFPATVAIPGTLTYSGTTTLPQTLTTGISAVTQTITQSSATSALTLGGTLTTGSLGTRLLDTNAASLTVASSISGSGSLFVQSLGAGSIAFTGSVNTAGDLVSSGTGTGKVFLSGSLGAAVTSLSQRSSSSALVLNSPNLSFAGPVVVETGSLVVTANDALGKTVGSTTVKSGATLDLSNVTYSTAEPLGIQSGTLLASSGISSFAGTISLSSGTAAFQVNGTSLTLSGSISGSAGFVKSGSGTLYLTGQNTGTGPMFVSAGTLCVNSGTSLGTGAVNLANATSLVLNAPGDTTLNAPVSGSGSIVKSGTGTVSLAAANTTTGTITVTGGTLKVLAGASLGTGTINVNPGAYLAFALNANTTIPNVITGTVVSANPSFRLTWNGGAVGGPLPVITSGTSTTVTKGSNLNYNITASNGPNTFSSTSLPAGISLDSNTGALSGTPTATGLFNIPIKVTNPGGSITFNLALTVDFPPSIPVISQQPNSITVLMGSVGTMTAKVVSHTALTYQWKRNGVLIDRAYTVAASNTDITVNLPISGVTSASEGMFTLWTKNAVGTAESSPAILRVDPGTPKLGLSKLLRAGYGYDLSKAQPNAIIDFGSNFISNDVFQVNAFADPTATFTWSWAPLKPGSFSTIASQTTSTFDFGAADVPKSPGYYMLTIKGKSGSLSMRFRVLSFSPAKSTFKAILTTPVIITNPAPVVVTVGGAANFGSAFSGTPYVYEWYRTTSASATGTLFAKTAYPYLTINPTMISDSMNYYVVARDYYNQTGISTRVALSVIPRGE
jgi:autotransporter-associated beta strand protein